MNIVPIQAAVQYHYQHGLATATQRCYNGGQQHYLQFCTQTTLIPIPTSENTLSGLAYTSIKIYLSSIGNLHSSCSQHDAYHKALTPHLEQALRGIKSKQSSTRTKRVRLSITSEIMHQIHSILSRFPTEFEIIMLWAACHTVFFGFLRVREITVPSSDAYNSSVHLPLKDVALQDCANHYLV